MLYLASWSSHHALRWLYWAEQHEIVHASALLLPVLWLLLIVQVWYVPALPSNTRLTRSSTITKKWKMKVKSSSRLALKLVGVNPKCWQGDIRCKSKSQVSLVSLISSVGCSSKSGGGLRWAQIMILYICSEVVYCIRWLGHVTMLLELFFS